MFTQLEEFVIEAQKGSPKRVAVAAAANALVLRSIQEAQEQGLVEPRGTILVADTGQPRDILLEAILDNRIKITASRCGDFQQAIPAMETLLKSSVDLSRIITDRMPVSELPAAFERARSADSLKVVVSHE